jgi:hypothetical protein
MKDTRKLAQQLQTIGRAIVRTTYIAFLIALLTICILIVFTFIVIHIS